MALLLLHKVRYNFRQEIARRTPRQELLGQKRDEIQELLMQIAVKFYKKNCQNV
jgi:hypothetical protein